MASVEQLGDNVVSSSSRGQYGAEGRVKELMGENIIRQLVGTLSLVTHKGLYQGEKQTSICHLVILHTSH